MSLLFSTTARALATALSGLVSLCAVTCFGAGEPHLAAVSALGTGDAAVIQLVRELTEWRARAEAAELSLSKAGLPVPAQTKLARPAQAQVVGSIEAERIVILAAGQSSGAVLGALVSVGDGVIVKVVESRETVSAALVDQKYQGKIGALEGSRAQLLVVRP
jgi:hypothetical protein